jgi:hypothetical protein
MIQTNGQGSICRLYQEETREYYIMRVVKTKNASMGCTQRWNNEYKLYSVFSVGKPLENQTLAKLLKDMEG